LHGRLDELVQLQDIYRAVGATGRPQLVTVTGNAGVGKSRLVREFMDWALRTDPALTTLGGRCLPYGEDITYRPLAEVLADLTGVTTSTDPTEAAAAISQLTSKHLVDEDSEIATAALLRMIGLESPETGAAPPPRRVRELLRTIWLSLMSGLAADGPVILLIEDIHWAGEALLDLVEHVVRRGEGPLLVLCPARPELNDRHPTWGENAGHTTTISLDPLDDDAAERLATHLLAHAGLPITDAGRITDRAGGNPFFIEELAREMSLRRSDDHGTDEAAELPATIQGVLSARIDLLDRAERHALQAASVVGRIFWPSAIAAITGMTDQSVEAILHRLEGLQLIRVTKRSTRSDELEYIFQHILIREAAYARLSRRDLAPMHAAVADWLEEHGSDAGDEAERLAFHTWRAHDTAAVTPEIPPNEVDRLRRLSVIRLAGAAARARERAAFGRSRQLGELALQLAEEASEKAVASSELGLTALSEYDGDAAWDYLRTAVDWYLEAPDTDPQVVAMTAAVAAETPLRWRGTVRQLPAMEEVLRYINVGIEHAGGGDSEALATLLTGLAFAPTTPGPQGSAARTVISVDEGFEAGQRAREMARRLGMTHLESAALDALQTHALWGGRVQEAAQITSERLELVAALSDPWEVGDTYAMAAWLAYDFGRYTLARDRALHGYKRTIDEAPSVALHNLSWSALARVQLGEWGLVQGSLGLALGLLDDERQERPPHYAAPLFGAAAMVAEYRGDSDEADRLLSVLHRVWSSSDLADRGGHPLARWVKHTGPIFLRRREFDTVAELVASEDAEPMGRESDRLSILCDLVALKRDWEMVDTAVEQALATASAYGLSALSAHAERLEGRASLAAGDRRGGLALLDSARERFDAHGDHWEAARTGLDIAETGGDIDLTYLQRFFTDIGSVDEQARAEALGRPS
jgi:type II secretory pathway predicted ATPase ExeA